MKNIFFALFAALFIIACTKDNGSEIIPDTESGLADFWNSKWERIDYINGTYLDLSGDTPMFCSQSDWSKFEFSRATQVNSSTIRFTITNLQTDAYVTITFSKASESTIEGKVYETNMPEWTEGTSYGLYAKTTKWCSESKPVAKRYMYVIDYWYSGARTLPLNLYRYPYNSSSKSYGKFTKMFRYGETMPSYGQDGTLTITDEIDNYDGYYVLRDQKGKYVGGLFDIAFTINQTKYVVAHNSSE